MLYRVLRSRDSDRPGVGDIDDLSESQASDESDRNANGATDSVSVFKTRSSYSYKFQRLVVDALESMFICKA